MDIKIKNTRRCTITMRSTSEVEEMISLSFIVQPENIESERTERPYLVASNEFVITCTDKQSIISNKRSIEDSIAKILPNFSSFVFCVYRLTGRYIRCVQIEKINFQLHDEFFMGVVYCFTIGLLSIVNYDITNYYKQCRNDWIIESLNVSNVFSDDSKTS